MAPPGGAPTRMERAAFIAAALVMTAAMNAQFVAAGLATGVPVDPDGWTRLLRVRAFWEDGGWYPADLPYLAAPGGLSLHWTWPLDLIVLAGAWIGVHGFGAAPDNAILVAAALACPLLHAATGVALGEAARQVWPDMPLAPYLALLAMFGNGVLNAYSMIGRSDHHTLIACLAAIGFACALRAASEPRNGRVAVAAGLAFGAGIWVGPEVPLVALPCCAAFGVIWVVGPGGAAMARQGLRIALGMAAMTALATMAERPPAQWLATEYDKVSLPHVAMALVVAGVFAGALGASALPRIGRLLAGAALGAAGLGLLVTLYPGTFDGPSAAAPWMRELDEMQPVPWRDPQRIADTLSLVGIAPAAFLGLIALPWNRLRPARWQHAALLAAVLVPTLLAALMHRRFGAMMIIPGAVAAAGLLGIAMHLPFPALLRWPVALLAVLLLAPATLSAPFGRGTAAAPAAAQACAAAALAAPLRTAVDAAGPAYATKAILASDFHLGAEAAWHERLRFVAAPYHRADAAVVDARAFFTAGTPDAAEAIARRRRIGFVLLCPGDFDEDAPFAARLRAGPLPDWLVPVPLEGAMGPLLWRVRQDRDDPPRAPG